MEVLVKGVPMVIAVSAGGVITIPYMMASAAVGAAVDAVIGDKIEQVKEHAKNELNKYLQDSKGLSAEQSQAIVGGLIFATEAVRDTANLAHAAKSIKLKSSQLNTNVDKPHIFEQKIAVKDSTKSFEVKEVKFMGKVGKEAEALLKKQYDSIHEHVKTLVANDVIKIDLSKPAKDQIAGITRNFQKQFVEYQKNVITSENERYIMKIIGSGQVTKTFGHSAACDKLGIELAKSSEVKFVFLNQGVKKATGFDGFTSNRRPDVTFITNDGKVHMIEVPSVSDTERDLIGRIQSVKDQLPSSIQGTIDVKYISDILKGK